MWNLAMCVLSAVAAVGCMHLPPRMLVLEASGHGFPPSEPVRIYVAPEEDESGHYEERMARYRVGWPLRDRIQDALGARQLRAQSTEGGRRGFTRTIDNPFTVVWDSTHADLIIRSRVVAFDFAIGRQVTGEFEYEGTAAIAAPATAGARDVVEMYRAQVVVAGTVTRRGDDTVVRSFRAEGRSGEKMAQRSDRETEAPVAYREAVERAVEDYLRALCECVE